MYFIIALAFLELCFGPLMNEGHKWADKCNPPSVSQPLTDMGKFNQPIDQ